MKITDIKQQQKRADRYSIYIDGKYRFALSEAALTKAGLRPDQQLDETELAAVQETARFDKAYDRALRYVTLRPRSRWELVTYLEKKGYEVPTIEAVLGKLDELELVDDRAFAKAWVEYRQNLRPRSRRQLTAELRQKRIDNDIIEEVVGVIDNEQEVANIQEIAQRKRKQSRYQDPQKLMAYLSRQGFNYGLIKRALEELD